MDRQIRADLHGDPNARDRNPDNIPVYGQDQILVNNNDDIIVQNNDNKEEDDIVADNDGVFKVADVTIESINQQWKHIQAKTREMEKKQALRAERKRFEDEKFISRMSRDISKRSGGSLDETFESRIQKTKNLIQENQDNIGAIQLQPTQQLQITNLKKEIEEKEHQIRMMMLNIYTLKRFQSDKPDRQGQKALEDLQDETVRQTEQLEKLKVKLTKTKETASKFQSYLEMPEYQDPPRGYRRKDDVLDGKIVQKALNMIFNPAQFPNVEFVDVWEKALKYGKKNYLNEEEHIEVLGEMLGGEPLCTFEHCRKTSNGLKEIVNDMIIMYGKMITINDYKRQLNEFTREVGESIRKTMLRYRQILNKTKHGVPDKVWKHTSQLKQMLALKMYITAKTKAEIEHEEARNDNEGSTMLPIEHWINRVEEFEMAHNEVPTKAIKPMILTATMAPAQQLEEFQAQGKQLQHYKVNHFNQTKDLVDAIQHLNQKIDQISINSAMPKSNPKLDTLQKAYTNGKFAPKMTNYVKHPQIIPTK